MVLLSMAVVSALILIAGANAALSVACAVVTGLIVVKLILPVFRILASLCRWTVTVVPAVLSGLFATLDAALTRTSTFPHPVLFSLTAYSFLRYFGMVVLNVWILHLLVPTADIVHLALAYPAILLVMSLPVFPGGLGVVELSWTGVLIAQGIDPQLAVAAALALRVISTIAFLAIAPILILNRSKQEQPG